MFRKNYLLIVLLFAVSFASYANTITNDFVWDDTEIARENPDIREIRNIPKLLVSPYGHPSQFGRDVLFYRPAVMISYIADYKLWGIDGGGFHITNIILHSLTVLMIFFFLVKISENAHLSFLSSLIFSTHPIHTQSVSWISGRTDILCALFYILAMILFFDSKKRKGWIKGIIFTASIISFFFSLLSKEMAIILPLLLIAYELLAIKNKRLQDFIKDCLPRYSAFIPPVIFYLFLRRFAMKGNIYHSSSDSALVDRLSPMAGTFSDYIRFLLFPFNLNSLYPPESNSFHLPAFLLLLFFLTSIFYMAYIKRTEFNRLLLFGSIWLITTLLPVSNLIPFSPITKSEHFLYLPSAGFSIIAAIFIADIFKISTSAEKPSVKLTAVALTGIIILSFISLSLSRNKVWKNELTLFSDQVRRNPGFARAHFNLGLAYKAEGNTVSAMNKFQTAASMEPSMSYAYVNIGNIFFDNGDTKSAIEYYLKALNLNKSDGYLRNNLGVAFGIEGKTDEALKEFQEALKINPQFVSPYVNLGNLYASIRNFEKSLQYLNKAIEIDPRSNNKARIIRALVYINTGKLKDAEADLGNADDSLANKFTILIFLGNAYSEKGFLKDALSAYLKARLINPQDQSVNDKIMSIGRAMNQG